MKTSILEQYQEQGKIRNINWPESTPSLSLFLRLAVFFYVRYFLPTCFIVAQVAFH